MSRANNKSPNTGYDILNTLQTEMCDVVYRYLYSLMKSLSRYALEINLDKDIIITLSTESDFSVKNFYTYIQEGKSARKYLSEVNFNSKSLKDPVLNLILGKKEFESCRPEKYAEWFVNLKLKMQELLEEQKKFENILEDIRNIPMFSPEREVLIEKK